MVGSLVGDEYGLPLERYVHAVTSLHREAAVDQPSSNDVEKYAVVVFHSGWSYPETCTYPGGQVFGVVWGFVSHGMVFQL